MQHGKQIEERTAGVGGQVNSPLPKLQPCGVLPENKQKAKRQRRAQIAKSWALIENSISKSPEAFASHLQSQAARDQHASVEVQNCRERKVPPVRGRSMPD